MSDHVWNMLGIWHHCHNLVIDHVKTWSKNMFWPWSSYSQQWYLVDYGVPTMFQTCLDMVSTMVKTQLNHVPWPCLKHGWNVIHGLTIVRNWLWSTMVDYGAIYRACFKHVRTWSTPWSKHSWPCSLTMFETCLKQGWTWFNHGPFPQGYDVNFFPIALWAIGKIFQLPLAISHCPVLFMANGVPKSSSHI